jgi:hypothetical protein
VFGVKSIRVLVETFPSINFVGLHPLSSNLWADKWDHHEGYGGPNLGEKGFQLFQLL